MAQLFANNAYGSLAGSINGAATTLVLASGNGAKFPSPSGGDFFLATLIGLDANGIENAWEIVKCTARYTDQLTVVRAQEGTTATSWNAGTRIEIRITSAGLASKQDTLISNTNIKTVGGTSLLGSGDIPIIGGIQYVKKTSAYTLANLDGVIADTSGGVFTLTLPASPSVGTQVYIADGGDWSVNNLTIDPNGATIESQAAGETLVCNIGGLELHLIYDGSKWNVHTQAAAQGGSVVVGPASAADNTLPRFDGTTGKLLQGSSIYVNDSGNIGVGISPDATGRLSVSGASSDTWPTTASGLTINGASTGTSTITSYLDDSAITIGVGVTQKTGITVNGQTSASGSSIDFRTGNAKRATLDSSGKLDLSVRAVNSPLADNDLSFDMSARNNFTCTTAGSGTLTFTNITAGQSGFILLTNAGNHTISAAATTKVSSTLLSRISASGTYLLSYFSNGTNVYVVASEAFV